jgi:hypothetical protein
LSTAGLLSAGLLVVICWAAGCHLLGCWLPSAGLLVVICWAFSYHLLGCCLLGFLVSSAGLLSAGMLVVVCWAVACHLLDSWLAFRELFYHNSRLCPGWSNHSNKSPGLSFPRQSSSLTRGPSNKLIHTYLVIKFVI